MDYVPKIDQLAAEFWKSRNDERQAEIQRTVHRLGYSLKEWTDALRRGEKN